LAGYSERELRRRLCKSYIERDRNLLAEETGGYTTRLFVLHPPSCSPKNDVLVGIPPVDSTLDSPAEDETGRAGSVEEDREDVGDSVISAEEAVMKFGLAI
jgi:hypothetical protein